jgi:hypothetical protein
MKNEPAPLLDGSAAHYGAFADRIGQADHRVGIAQVQFVQNVGEAQIGQFLVDHEPHGPLAAMAHN